MKIHNQNVDDILCHPVELVVRSRTLKRNLRSVLLIRVNRQLFWHQFQQPYSHGNICEACKAALSRLEKRVNSYLLASSWKEEGMLIKMAQKFSHKVCSSFPKKFQRGISLIVNNVLKNFVLKIMKVIQLINDIQLSSKV